MYQNKFHHILFKTWKNLKNLSYRELAVKIILDFCADEFSESEIKDLVKKSYKNFRVKDVVAINKTWKYKFIGVVSWTNISV